jgi:hypothetical protein
MTSHVIERMIEHCSHVSHSEKRAALDTALASFASFNTPAANDSPPSTGTSGGSSSS